MMENKETDELFRSPFESLLSQSSRPDSHNGETSSLSLLDLNDNLDCWDDCDPEIILSDLVLPETTDISTNQSNECFTDLATYLDEDSQKHRQTKETFRRDGKSTVNKHSYRSSIIIQDTFESNDVPTLSKNAVAARENRLKKKKYVKNLERSFERLNEENVHLKSKIASYESTVTKLNAEVTYLKNVLANQSTLSALLQNIQCTPSIKFKTSLKTKCTCSTSTSSDLTPQRSDTNISSSLADSRENICNTLRRSKRTHTSMVNNSETSESVKVRKVVSGSVITNDSLHEAVKSANEQTFTANMSVTYVDESAGDMDKSKISSSQVLNGDVCLHVTGETVSIKFCQQCSKKSQSQLAYNDHSYFRSSHDS